VNKEVLQKYIEVHRKIAELEEAKGYLESGRRKSVSIHDKEARLMKGRDGMLCGYNAQFIIDNKHKLLADSEVVTEEVDHEQLEPMVESLAE